MTQNRTQPWVVTFDSDNLSCYEDGGWMGLKVKPHTNSSEYPVDEGKQRWDFRSLSRENRPAACELLRRKNKAGGWSLSNGTGPPWWCTVYEEVTSLEASNVTIRGIACSSIGLNRGSEYNQTNNHSKLLEQMKPRENTKFNTYISRIQRPTTKPSIITNETVKFSRETLNGTTSVPPTMMPIEIDKPDHLLLSREDVVVVLVLSVLLFCSLLIALRRSRLINSLTDRVQNFVICQSWNNHLVFKRTEQRFISNSTSAFESNHYLHPFTKKTAVLSEKEYLPLDDETT